MASSVGSYRAGSGTVLMLVRADEQPASPDYGTGTCALVPVPNLLGIGGQPRANGIVGRKL